MKKFAINSINRISFLLLLLVAGTLFSCEEEDPTAPAEAKAAPVIEAVRSMNPAKADSTFKQSTLGSTIVIKGRNLEDTRFISFNGYNASFNTAYASENYVIVRIPEQTPTVATATNVSNKLVVSNSKGEAVYDFTVLPPAPIIEAMSNEAAKAGDVLTLYGKYFYFVKDVTFPGDVKGTNVTASADGTTLTVTVPAGVNPAQGSVVVTSESGKSAANARTQLYSTLGLISNFDNKSFFGWGIPGENIVTSAPGITGLDGKFGMVQMAVPGNGGWANARVMHFADYGAGSQILPTTPADNYNANDPIANFEVRMEVAAANTNLNGIQVQVMIPAADGKEYDAKVDLKNFVRSTDGKWYTVAVPLANLANGTNKYSKYSDALASKQIRVAAFNTNAADVPVTLGFDNIRIINTTK